MPMRPTTNTNERDRFVEDLLAYMTLAEKAGQLVFLNHAPDPSDRGAMRKDAAFFDRLHAGLIGAVAGVSGRAQTERLQRIAVEETRLGIPLFVAAETGTGFDTIMPAPAAAAASWDSAAVETAERRIASEARSRGVNWALSPEITLVTDTTDPDYAQSSGSEPFLAALVAQARVRGLQTDADGATENLLACMRLADIGDSPQQGSQQADFLHRLVRENTQDRPVGSIAAGPGIAAKPLRDGLQAPGVYAGILLSEWSELAAQAGQTLAEPGFAGLSVERLVAAVNAGHIPVERIDEAVRRVLAAKFDLGLFRSPFAQVERRNELDPAQTRQSALDLAVKSIVLLRNDPPLLPLTARTPDILLVGAPARDRRLPMGGRDGNALSLVDGLEQAGVTFKYVPGLALRPEGMSHHRMIDADRMAIGMATEAARRADRVIVVVGEESDNGRTPDIGEARRQLITSIKAVNPRIVLVNLGGHPIDPLIDGEPLPCVVHAGSLGSMSGSAIALMLAGQREPTGRLPAAIPASATGNPLALGHGSGYGSFVYGKFSLEMGADRMLASLDLRNNGELAGSEMIQLYVRRCDGPRASKRAELRGFERVTLEAGETRRISFEIGIDALGQFEENGQLTIEEGRYAIALGPDSRRLHGAEITLPSSVAQAMRGLAGGAAARERAGLRRA